MPSITASRIVVECAKLCVTLALIMTVLVFVVTNILPQLRNNGDNDDGSHATIARTSTYSSEGDTKLWDGNDANDADAATSDNDLLSLDAFNQDAASMPKTPSSPPPPIDLTEQQQPSSPSDKWNWFDFDKSKGIDPYKPPISNLSRTKLAVRRIWQYDISLQSNASRSKWQRKHPQLVFIKGLKVGGTSVAMALDNAARHYSIRLQDDIDGDDARRGFLDAQQVKCHLDRSLYFHHAQYSAWMSKCIPFARFVTLLREPVSQTLSWEAMTINRNYYIEYPDHACNRNRTTVIRGELEDQLKRVTHCNDIPFRKNLTTYLIGKRVRHHWPVGDPGEAVTITSRWISDVFSYDKITSELLIRKLNTRYFLVGVTERLNEFLVLLALHMGWEPTALMYRKCKATNMEVTKDSFTKLFPDLGDKLAKAAEPMTETYNFFKREFDAKVKSLGPWFQAVVRDFEDKLHVYQKQHASPLGDFKWRMHHYLDGEWEYC